MAVKFKDEDPRDLTRRMEDAAGRIEKLAVSLQQSNLDAALDRALRSSRRELERSIGSLVQDSIVEAFGGRASGRGGVASLIAGLIPGFARGGILSTRTPVAHAGEAGPEVVLPLKRGRDGRLGVVMETARPPARHPVDVTIRHEQPDAPLVESDAALTEAVTAAVSRAMDDAIDQRLALHQRPGGLLHGRGEGGWR